MQEQIHFDNLQGEKLAGTLHLPADPGKFGLVLGHCFTCSRHTGILRRIASDAAGRGFSVLRFDFSGNGQSEGRFSDSTYSKQISEIGTAAQVLADRGAEWIGVAGHSLGGVVAFLAAARNDRFSAACALASRLGGIQAIHFLSPDQRRTLRRTGEVRFSSRGRSLKLNDHFFSDAQQFDPTGILKSFPKPLLIVHGQDDEIIPLEQARKAAAINADSAELVVIPGADHMFAGRQPEVSRIVVDWFANQISPSA